MVVTHVSHINIYKGNKYKDQYLQNYEERWDGMVKTSKRGNNNNRKGRKEM